jgi:phytoene synthase
MKTAISALDSSYRYCERLARHHAGNFYHAFRILPRDQRRSMCALYAFLRVSDDLIDNTQEEAAKRDHLRKWRLELDLALNGRFTHRVHAAFQDTLTRHAIPRKYVDAVLDGIEMDVNPMTYATFEELYQYCFRVASVVGMACLHIWGYNDERAKGYAEKAGIAFQLTNILRDLAEDARRGRIYLPLEDLARFQYSIDDLRAGRRTAGFVRMMGFEIERARQWYVGAQPLVEFLPAAGRAVFTIMSRTYAGLLDAIENCGYDVFSSRIRLNRWHKLGLVARAIPMRLGLF